ncbi:hypothetical protein CRG98_023568 [Punica granatum]|uniref:Uncharacterized protein n=1 Tax=Punica granatum TaxID=22663 RepID=A0A2I0JIE0_PUNGR|nr:hypothetical protein CRG98_023568 [Punica granatum]
MVVIFISIWFNVLSLFPNLPKNCIKNCSSRHLNDVKVLNYMLLEEAFLAIALITSSLSHSSADEVLGPPLPRFQCLSSTASPSASIPTTSQPPPPPPPPSTSHPLELGLLGLSGGDSDGFGAFASSSAAAAAAFDLSSLASSNFADLARHYRHCYWELSKLVSGRN